ncbi:hypothetical protein OH791_38760 (plasmid) [Streptomyces anulatus]|uniref:hypothetical protein n=1 Tax=Streptomyces anulatus TaxID=1892 RepID=UPI002F91A519|nr:hypothetical protein OH791_38760 [Streptomyces anulatus]
MTAQPPPERFLPQWLSPGRLAPYRAAAGSQSAAVDLYRWNIAVSAAVYEGLHLLEVVLRNAMHDQLVIWHQSTGNGGRWMDDRNGILEDKARKDIATARARTRKPSPTEGHAVAELTFGFWRYLLARRYQDNLWRLAVRHAFPHLQPQTRSEVEKPLIRLHKLRNRIAHLEPVHRRDLLDDRQDILTVLGYICPDTATGTRPAAASPTSSRTGPPPGRPLTQPPRPGEELSGRGGGCSGGGDAPSGVLVLPGGTRVRRDGHGRSVRPANH